jgi:hypothetical protein
MGEVGAFLAVVVGTVVHAETAERRTLYFSCWSGVRIGCGEGLEEGDGYGIGVF